MFIIATLVCIFFKYVLPISVIVSMFFEAYFMPAYIGIFLLDIFIIFSTFLLFIFMNPKIAIIDPLCNLWNNIVYEIASAYDLMIEIARSAGISYNWSRIVAFLFTLL